MKILFATENNTLESKIARRFGEAPYYLIYDSETKQVEARVNSGHDDSHSSLIELVNQGVLTYIVGNVGPNAFNILNDLGAKLYLARGLSAQDALNSFLKNELELLTESTLKRPIRNH